MRAAIKSPLLENISIDGAKGVLLNVASGEEFKMSEMNEFAGMVKKFISHDAHVFYGHVLDKSLAEKVKVTLIATGFPSRKKILKPPEHAKKKVVYDPNKDSKSEEDINLPAYLRYKCRKLS